MTTAFWYGKGLMHVMSDINVLVDPLKLALCTASYTPNQDTHEVFTSVTNEIVGTGYVAGGLSVTNVKISYVAASKRVFIDFDNVSWPTSALTARKAVLYKNSGNPATSQLIAWQDNGSDVASSGGVFQFNLDATGFVYGQVS